MILLLISIVLILALFAMNISSKSGIPSLLLFLSLGIICKLIGIDFVNYELGEHLSTFALIVIMFYGGFGTSWKMGKPVIKEAVALATLGVVFTALVSGYFIHLVFKFPLLESLLVGSIIASTDYASVSNILTSKNLNLKYNTASLLELESGSNDPTAYTMTILFISLILGKDISIPFLILKQFSLGILIGFVFAVIIEKLIDKIDLKKDGLAIIFMTASALFTYSLTNVLGGNGFLAVYIFGIKVGNKSFVGKKDIIFFFDGFTELMSIGLFFILGLLATPSKIIETLPIAVLIMVFVSLIVRPLVVFGLMAPFKLKKNQVAIVSWAGLRGAAAIVFAIMAINNLENINIDIYHIVFGICFLSCLVQGSLMPLISKKSDMVDLNDTVLKTFNFYVDKSDISFLKTKVKEGGPLEGKLLKEIKSDYDFIIAKIKRGQKTIVPRGNVRLETNDLLVVAGEEYFDPEGYELLEFTISHGHDWIGKEVIDLKLKSDKLIIAINRNHKFIRAHADTVIEENDRILMITSNNIVEEIEE